MSTDRLVKEITIVGGGTAGWLAASILQSKLLETGRTPSTRVVLIESPHIPIIGVGEGTLPAMVGEIRKLGIPEREFIRHCNAAFKLGVRFVNWNALRDGQFFTFTNAFQGRSELPGGALNYFAQYGAVPGRDPNDAADSLHAGVAAMKLGRAPRQLPKPESTDLRYAYHFDASKFAEFLRERAVARGVVHVLDDVDDVEFGEDGAIASLQLRSRGRWPVELVIDCTGFRSVLGKAVGASFMSYNKNLLCDKAVALQIPHSKNAPFENFTTATALSAGWAWRLPLWNRVGTGYVFSSAFRTDEEAVEEFCKHLGVRQDQVEPRIISMRVGRLKNGWNKNCISIGLAGGFVEPLEATAIVSIQMAVGQIADHLPMLPISPTLVSRFNKIIASLYDGIRDFILFHYYTANRTEPFWLAARSQDVLTETLKENLEVWRHRLPSSMDFDQASIFRVASYGSILASKGFFREQPFAATFAGDPERWKSHGIRLRNEIHRVAQLPSSRELLAAIRGSLDKSDELQE